MCNVLLEGKMRLRGDAERADRRLSAEKSKRDSWCVGSCSATWNSVLLRSLAARAWSLRDFRFRGGSEPVPCFSFQRVNTEHNSWLPRFQNSTDMVYFAEKEDETRAVERFFSMPLVAGRRDPLVLPDTDPTRSLWLAL